MKYFTLIGNHDFIDKGSPGLGAALTIFLHYKDEIDGVYIFTSPDKPNAAYKHTYLGVLEIHSSTRITSVIPMSLSSTTLARW